MKKHKWHKNDYDNGIDIFAYSIGFHNGPKCKVCGYEFCHHCFPGGYKTNCPEPLRRTPRRVSRKKKI